MNKLVYRGVAYEKGADRKVTLADQMRRYDLVYRGNAHDGEAPREVAAKGYDHVYRGVRYA